MDNNEKQARHHQVEFKKTMNDLGTLIYSNHSNTPTDNLRHQIEKLSAKAMEHKNLYHMHKVATYEGRGASLSREDQARALNKRDNHLDMAKKGLRDLRNRRYLP